MTSLIRSLLPLTMAGQKSVERVFPLRIEPLVTPPQDSEPTSSESACHVRKKTKFDGPKIWGDSEAKSILVPQEDAKFAAHIQDFGALVALRMTADTFSTIACSQNATSITSLSWEQLFEPACFSRFIVLESRDDFRLRLKDVADEALKGVTTASVEPEICSLSIVQHSGQTSHFWCTIHATSRDPTILLCEFEGYIAFLEQPFSTSRGERRQPSRRLNHVPTQEEYLQATTTKSLPLRYSRSQHATPHDRIIDPISLMNQIQRQYSNTSSIPQLYDAIVGTVAELTKFDRVMVYRFDECKCGAVVGELLNPEASKDVFLGLHFPSSDVPIPMRESYKLDRIQVLRQKARPESAIVDHNKIPVYLDLSRCYLRAFSPEQVAYFSRMNVSSAMSVSLVVDQELWGLIMCHSYDSEVTVISPRLKELCRIIGQSASTQIERLLSKEKFEMRSSLMAGLSLKSPAAFLTQDTANLLQVFGAEFGLLTLNGETRAIGPLEVYQEALAILQYFRSRKPTKVISSQKIATDFPDLNYEPGFKVLAGVLVIPLSDSGADFLTLFRKGQLLEIFWAGNEQEQFQYIGGEIPEPTAGLLRWAEHMTDTSREWTDDQMDIATVIGLLYGTFIKTWRQKEAMEERGRVKRLLISNASHEVRTPLNSIVNYLEIILDGQIDDNTRDQVEKSLTASKSLIYAINDLLDLTRVVDHSPVMLDEKFNLKHELDGVVDAFREEAIRKGLNLSTDIDSDTLPSHVKGDPMRLRQAVSDILSNAVEYTGEGQIVMKVAVLESNGDQGVIEITVQDEGIGMSETQLDSLFQHLEQVIDDPESETSSQPNQGAIGLGLAVVARFVRNCQGQLRVQSELLKGTTVQLNIPIISATTSAVGQRPLDTPPSDQEMADLLKNIEERTQMINRITQISQTDSAPLLTPATELTSTDSLPMSSPALSLGSQASAIGSSSQFSPTLDARGSREFPFPPMLDASFGKLRILVAEDNPLNSRILNIRLSKKGYHVTITPDGRAYADIFVTRPEEFDVILMDLQMPLLDGHGSTKLIRSFEAVQSSKLSEHASHRGRIPIFAVLASLLEDSREDYMSTGFDGWVMKPIDFKRLKLLMHAISDKPTREKCLYRKGDFESGGWFKDT
ncbi:uncharacterized protein LY89DRAFT_620335 [Mollisia scopiformis]|uniref:Phytochrome n=1 Tax=Mollisia scopiformis TaxID=149040 RepID=A0A194X4F2_MOLSC|nr:uncharacterized protein LY89DRAFT_620335 [Mollisia scopiformis]KUJ15051.1 hypothetical protein LY89DRAFT_620335 [Mollisia scopiformis]